MSDSTDPGYYDESYPPSLYAPPEAPMAPMGFMSAPDDDEPDSFGIPLPVDDLPEETADDAADA